MVKISHWTDEVELLKGLSPVSSFNDLLVESN